MFKDPKTFTGYSNDMVKIHENIDDYNPYKNVKYCLHLII